MDPLGFALENFDAVGRWRTRGREPAADRRVGKPAGRRDIRRRGGLRQRCWPGRKCSSDTLTEKLLTYALGPGRRLPATRRPCAQILREAAADDYRFSSLVAAIAQERAVSDETSRTGSAIEPDPDRPRPVSETMR